MAHRIKTKVNGEDHIYPEEFKSQAEAKEFLEKKIPQPQLNMLIDQGMFSFFYESTLVDGRGNPIQVETK